MDFELTTEQREIQALAREFAQAEIEPHAADWDREHRFPTELYPKLAELGLMGVCVPEEYGGAGADFVSYVLVLEELSRADAGVGVTVAVHTSAVTLPILALRVPTSRGRGSCRRSRAGELLGAFALTEPEAGLGRGRRCARRPTPDDGGWHIDGSKRFISTARYAGTFLFFARTDPCDARARAASRPSCSTPTTSASHATRRSSGSTRRRRATWSSTRTSTRDRLLGEEGKGFTIAMATLDGGRIGIAAQAVGIAQAAFEAARAYALERKQFGKPIARAAGDPAQAREHVDGDRRRAAARATAPRG